MSSTIYMYIVLVRRSVTEAVSQRGKGQEDPLFIPPAEKSFQNTKKYAESRKTFYIGWHANQGFLCHCVLVQRTHRETAMVHRERLR